MTDGKPRQRIGEAQAALRFTATTEGERAALRRLIRAAQRELAGLDPASPESTKNDGTEEAARRFGTATTQQKDNDK